jgi:hypothetical protein
MTPLSDIDLGTPLSARAARRPENIFRKALEEIVECGGLLSLRWLIYREETKPRSVAAPSLMTLAKSIEARWTVLEAMHGEGSLLVAESDTIRLAASVKGGRHGRKPQLLENAAMLRLVKGQEWWRHEHRLHSLAEAVQSPMFRP